MSFIKSISLLFKNKLNRINAKLSNEMTTEEILDKENINYTKSKKELDEENMPHRSVLVSLIKLEICFKKKY